MSAAFAAGLLEYAMEQSVNIVNAEVLLRERGIELVEQRNTDIGDFSSLITAEVTSEERTSIAAGTLFGNDMPRLVQKADCRLESFLDGILLILHPSRPAGRDRPGRQRLRPAPREHRPDVGGPGLEQARRRGDRRALAGLAARRPKRLAEVLALDSVMQAWIVKLPPQGQLPAWMGG